tara:strand:+ start:212 stop:613 length:402 start_codon:yes stop_codon:yes gene_type:complete
MISPLVFFLTSIVFGIMIFFSFVVAPITFKSLNEENARQYIRKIFPYYYNVNLLLCFIICIFFVVSKNFQIEFYLILTITILFGVSNYLLMPLINKFRDNNDDKKFKYLHFLSVIINFVQIIFLIIILFKNYL